MGWITHMMQGFKFDLVFKMPGPHLTVPDLDNCLQFLTQNFCYCRPWKAAVNNWTLATHVGALDCISSYQLWPQPLWAVGEWAIGWEYSFCPSVSSCVFLFACQMNKFMKKIPLKFLEFLRNFPWVLWTLQYMPDGRIPWEALGSYKTEQMAGVVS